MDIGGKTEGSGRVDFLGVGFHVRTIDEVCAWLAASPAAAPFNYVVTPSVDHLVRLHSSTAESEHLHDAYAEAGLCLCDSQVLARIGRLKGRRLPVVPGSDLTRQMFETVLRPGDKIAVVGGDANMLADLERRFPGPVYRQHIPPMGLRHGPDAIRSAVEFIEAEEPRFTFLAVGSPQQEMIAHLARERGRAKGIGLCIGASIDFLVGRERRAPIWMRQAGVEWLHRLMTQPRRLWRRYLVVGPRIFWIAARWKGGEGEERAGAAKG